MHYLGCLAVDRPRRTHNRGTERCRDRLMAQADPQQRSGGATHAHDIYADAGVSWGTWLRREAPCCIPGLAGRNLEDIPGSDGLLKIRKVKGTIACQETSGRADAYGRRAGKTRVIWLKLYCLNPNLQ